MFRIYHLQVAFMIKPFFSSASLLAGAVAFVSGLVLVVAAPASDIICRQYKPESDTCKNAKDLANILTGVASLLTVSAGATGIKASFDDEQLYTPHWLPGANKEELQEDYLAHIATRYVDELPISEFFTAFQNDKQP